MLYQVGGLGVGARWLWIIQSPVPLLVGLKSSDYRVER